MRIVATIDLYQTVQLLSFENDQPRKTFMSHGLPLNILDLGIVYCNSEINHVYTYICTEAKAKGKGEKVGSQVMLLIMKYLKDNGLLKRGR